METPKTTYITYSKGELWSRKMTPTNVCLAEIEAGTIGGRVVGLEDEWREVRNAQDRKEHASLEEAKEYAQRINDHQYDILMECHEQNQELE